MTPDQTGAIPQHVAIVGLGPSAHAYIDHVEMRGGRHAAFDETWTVNSFGDVIQHDRLFHMDDVANTLKEVDDETVDELARKKLKAMHGWLKTHPGPVYTSVPHPDFPCLRAYPLEEVINSVGTAYFNNSVAYAVALAIHEKVKKLSLFGCDYSYGPSKHEGKGRACVEFWLGVAAARGMHVAVDRTSTLMDACEPDRKFYGYEAYEVSVQPDVAALKVTLKPKEFIARIDLESQ